MRPDSHRGRRPRLVLLVNPPNSTQVFDDTSCTVTRAEDLTDWANMPSLGVLGLASAIADLPDVQPVYVDGTVVPWPVILRYVEEHAGEILAVCVSMLTASYAAGLELLAHAKAVRPGIRTVVGNDHVSAMPRLCFANHGDVIDFGFVGNEVVGPFRALIADLAADSLRSPEHYPGLAIRTADGVVVAPQAPEPVFTGVRYDLVDAVFPHTEQYDRNFRARVGPCLDELLDVELHTSVPVEFARGCIKFSRDDACTFCSIQYGGMWKNSVPDAAAGWRTIEAAFRHGYDFQSVTADELPLTFGSLLREMAANPPSWWADLPARDRPVLGGYARADGLSNPRNAATLRTLGIRYLMVGLDAGAATSLSALNKPLAPVRDNDPHYRAERMFQHNVRALRSARDEGLFLKAGFVLGHLGMTRQLLKENVESICTLVDAGGTAIASSDIEVLSPEPGSTDYRYLTEPAFATAAADRLGLTVADQDVRTAIADRHGRLDLFDREQAMQDYVNAVMPELTFDDLAAARAEIRAHCKAVGVVVGE